MMKSSRLIYLLITLFAISLQACYVDDDFKMQNTAKENFDALWKVIDEHYCFFQYKAVDWDSVYNHYAPRVHDRMSDYELFNLCSEMLEVLQDGHVNLVAPFATSYYRDWFEAHPVNYDERIVREQYLHFDYKQSGGIVYEKLQENIGYIYYDSFNNSIGHYSLDNILVYLSSCNGLIIDVRNNGGGSLSNVDILASRFLSQRTLAGYILHKTGPGHDDFSTPYPYYYQPVDKRIHWLKPVVVLTNRHTFSAANNFVQVMKSLPQVTIIGDCTGGGSGLPFTYNLPNGWSIRLSASPVLDANGYDTEWGIEPTIKVDMAEDAHMTGRDAILDKAIEYLLSK